MLSRFFSCGLVLVLVAKIAIFHPLSLGRSGQRERKLKNNNKTQKNNSGFVFTV